MEKFLASKLKLKLASKISLLRVNPDDDEFGHIISYHRQVYVHELNNENLPTSFLLRDE